MFYPFKSKAQPQRPGTSRSRRMPSGCGCGGREGPRALRSVCLSAQGQRLGWRRGTHVCQLHRALGLLPQPPPEGSCAVVNRAPAACQTAWLPSWSGLSLPCSLGALGSRLDCAPLPGLGVLIRHTRRQRLPRRLYSSNSALELLDGRRVSPASPPGTILTKPAPHLRRRGARSLWQPGTLVPRAVPPSPTRGRPLPAEAGRAGTPGAGADCPLARGGAGCGPRRGSLSPTPPPPRGRYTSAPAPRPAAARLPAPLALRPRASRSASAPQGGGKFAPGRPALQPPRSSCASAPRRAGRGPEPAPGACQLPGRPAPKGRPPGRRARAAAVPALAAGRRPAPRPRSSRAARSPLARSRTQTAFSCRRIALGPPRLLRKQGKPENNSPAARPQLSPRSAEPPR